MSRKIVYWVTTGIIAVMLLGSLSYLTGSDEVVAGFSKAGYPQYLRIILGIVKPVAAVVLIMPGRAAAEGVGVRRRDLRVDHGDDFGIHGRRDVVAPDRHPSAGGRLLPDPSRESPSVARTCRSLTP